MKTVELGTFTQKKEIEQKTKRKFKWKYLLYVGLFLLLTAINAGIAYAYTEVTRKCPEGETCNAAFLPGAISTLKNPLNAELKQNNGVTNILVVGIDTRPNSGLQNTDTIMVISVDRNNDSINMVSIPRDLWVAYNIDGVGFFQSKINGVFANAEASGKDGMDTMETLAEDITGVQIHYSALVTLEGFRDLIESVGGLNIDVPNGFCGLYPYEDNPEKGYFSICFKEGQNQYDGETALRYARIRNADGSEGSDFARARRQQIVIDALKKQILASSTLTNPSKLWDIYNIVKDNIKTSEFGVGDIKAGLDMRSFAEKATVANIVLDPAFGGLNNYIFTAPLDSGRGYSIQAQDTTYNDIQERLSLIGKYPKVFNEEPSIAIYNASGKKLQYNYGDLIWKQNPLFGIAANNITINYSSDKTGITIFDYTEGKKQGSVDYLKESLGITDIVTDISQAPKRIFNEDIAIVIIDESTSKGTLTTSTSSNSTNSQSN